MHCMKHKVSFSTSDSLAYNSLAPCLPACKTHFYDLHDQHTNIRNVRKEETEKVGGNGVEENEQASG